MVAYTNIYLIFRLCKRVVCLRQPLIELIVKKIMINKAFVSVLAVSVLFLAACGGSKTDSDVSEAVCSYQYQSAFTEVK
jgi:hypothetical protein